MTDLKNKTILLWILTILVSINILSSCQENNVENQQKAPIISFKNETDIYTVKVGKNIVIEPIVENDHGAIYSWKTDRKLLSTEKSLSYSWDKSGQIYVTFKVLTDDGTDEKEIKINVAELVPPIISLGVPKDGYIILINQELKLLPEINNCDEATYKWSIDGKEVSAEKDYIFKSDKTGIYKFSLATTNEDGKDLIEFEVAIKKPEEMPFSWDFENTSYNVSKGRMIRLQAFSIKNGFDAQYIWKIDGIEVQKSNIPLYIFNAEKEGVHTVSVTMKNSHNEFTQEVTVNVCPPEGTYKRQANALSSKDWNKVYEFLAAPGQFVNEDYTATTMNEAIIYAERRLQQNIYVSLGGFGGYIVLGFDHSINNDGGYNFQVLGNSFQGSSESGIVWVMQDENGDGLPNDTWYELKGSEYNKPGTIQDYEITYYKPRSIQMPVVWTDNQGKSGSVDYLPAYHRQDYYYPNWVKENSYTLRGTCLKSRTREVTPGYWSNDSFDWGYADNFSTADRLTEDENYEAGVNANHFKISDAITFDGKPANLNYIDFIKIQTGVNAKAGWLGENSTEVFGARDFNLVKTNNTHFN